MKIDANDAGNLQILQYYKTPTVGHTEKSTKESAVSGTAGKQYDRVDIMQNVSQEADFCRAVTSRVVKEVRAANSIGDIQNLKDQVQSGNYPIDTDRIAAAMLLETEK